MYHCWSLIILIAWHFRSYKCDLQIWHAYKLKVHPILLKSIWLINKRIIVLIFGIYLALESRVYTYICKKLSIVVMYVFKYLPTIHKCFSILTLLNNLRFISLLSNMLSFLMAVTLILMLLHVKQFLLNIDQYIINRLKWI